MSRQNRNIIMLWRLYYKTGFIVPAKAVRYSCCCVQKSDPYIATLYYIVYYISTCIDGKIFKYVRTDFECVLKSFTRNGWYITLYWNSLYIVKFLVTIMISRSNKK